MPELQEAPEQLVEENSERIEVKYSGLGAEGGTYKYVRALTAEEFAAAHPQFAFFAEDPFLYELKAVGDEFAIEFSKKLLSEIVELEEEPYTMTDRYLDGEFSGSDLSFY